MTGQAGMSVKYDVAEFFRKTFEESGVSEHVTMFVNLANDPVVERLITPRMALTAAEYLAFEQHMHILVILTDMTSFAEALREVSSSKGEIPSRKGYPGYLYSELATIYERVNDASVFLITLSYKTTLKCFTKFQILLVKIRKFILTDNTC